MQTKLKRHRVALRAAAAVLAAASFMTCSRVAPSREAACADKLGVTWSLDDGVTERISDFQRCLAA